MSDEYWLYMKKLPWIHLKTGQEQPLLRYGFSIFFVLSGGGQCIMLGGHLMLSFLREHLGTEIQKGQSINYKNRE